jgi:solute carrier family 10 (sodium/bile acid cotransporter), member 7
MSALRRFRIPIDRYLLLLLGAVALGLVLPARGWAHGAVEDLVYLAVAALFFLYGARLSPGAVWSGLSNWRLQALVFASTFALFPILGLAVGQLAKPFLPADLALGLIFVALLPSTVQSSIAFTSIARGNVPAALCSASISNMLGVVITPLLASLILTGKGGLTLHGMEDIGLQIVLPFAAGQAVRPFTAKWLLRHPALTQAFDRGSILIIVYAAFSAGAVAGVWSRVSAVDLAVILALDLVMLGAVLVATTLASRRLGFSKPDEIAIVFCGSKKSLASGMPIAAIIFPGHAVALIVLPLMLFHQAQLFACAILARRYGARPEAAPQGVEGALEPAAARAA